MLEGLSKLLKAKRLLSVSTLQSQEIFRKVVTYPHRLKQRAKKRLFKLKDQLGMHARIIKILLTRSENVLIIAQHLEAAEKITDGDYANRCFTACLKGDYENATQWAERMQRVAPDFAAGWAKMSEVCLAKNDPAGALENAEIALEKARKDRMLGRAIHNTALKAYHDALLINNRDEEAKAIRNQLIERHGAIAAPIPHMDMGLTISRKRNYNNNKPYYSAYIYCQEGPLLEH